MNYLKEYRLSANMNQAQLAEKLCVTQACISRWEHGIAYPEIDTAKQISKLLHIPFDLIFDQVPQDYAHALPIYDSITDTGATRTCTKPGCLLELSEREMRMLLPRKEQKLVKNGKEQKLVLEPDRFFGFYYSESDLHPYILKDTLNIIFATSFIYPKAVQLISIDGEDATLAQIVDSESDIVVVTNTSNESLQFRHFRASDIADGTLKIHGVVVQSRKLFLY